MKFINKNTQPVKLSRKQLRKAERKQKKEKKVQHFKKFHQLNKEKYQEQYPVEQQFVPQQQVQKTKPIKKKKKQPKKVIQQEMDEDDRIIQMYQKKLKLNKKTKKQKLSKEGFDDDLYDFLDNITRKVKNPNYKNNQIPDQQQQQQNIIEQNQHEEDYLDAQQLPSQAIQQEQQEQIQQNNNIQNHKNQILENNHEYNQQKEKITKSLNSLLNKVSDGNLAKIFKDINQIFQSNPKVIVYLNFAKLFVKFNVDNFKVIVHIFATHIALASALHHLYDNNFFAVLMKQIIEKYIELQKMKQEDFLQGEIDFNPVFQKRKNITNIFCYFYLFDSLTVDFMKQFIVSLLKNVTQSNIELLYLIIQNVGAKIRSDDPKILKDLILQIKTVIQQHKQSILKDNKKAEFILKQLNQIKFNKKSIVDPDQRMGFLKTFINKNIIAENNLTKKIFVISFSNLVSLDKTRNFWWEPNSNQIVSEQPLSDHQDQLFELDHQLKDKKKYYEELAKQQKMVTELRKKIFLTMITAQDYVDAAEKLLQLKIKRKNEIAAVLIQTMSQQSTFNMYYVHLANKLIEIFPKFKLAVQFSIWDHEKQFENYTLRKISNIARFLARLIIINEGCSLSMIKNLNDLTNLSEHQQIFLIIFLDQFYSEVTPSRLNELIRKIRQGDNNSTFKLILKQYLEQDYLEYVKKHEKPYKDKIKLTLRLLLIA